MSEESAPQNLWSFAERNFRLLVPVFSGLFLFGSGMLLAKGWRLRSPPPITYEVFEDLNEDVAGEGVEKEVGGLIKVDVSGAVKSPGVYELDESARVEDAISQAGGFSDGADKDWVSKNLNLAIKLSDGQKIYVPREGEVVGAESSGQVSGSQTSSSSGCPDKININTAPASQLECLYNVGEKRAQDIIDYRSSNPFGSIEEIMEVKGIGEKTFEKIKDQIVVR